MNPESGSGESDRTNRDGLAAIIMMLITGLLIALIVSQVV